jgi:hypothetical protein
MPFAFNFFSILAVPHIHSEDDDDDDEDEKDWGITR